MKWATIGLALLAVVGLATFGIYRWWSHDVANGPTPSTDPRLAQTSPFRNVRPEIRYVGDKACASCHVKESQSYRHHPMGRSLAPIEDVAPRQNYDKSVGNPFNALGFQFEVTRQGTQALHRERVRDAAGKVVAETVLPVRYAIGSGTHAFSYLIQHEGVITQSPITWFTQKNAWDLSPGFEQQRYRFERAVLPGCLFCHCNHVEPIPDTLNSYRQPIFQRDKNAGPALMDYQIGCERCHGPGELHVQARQNGTDDDTTIVNPRKLQPSLREAVCEQCHLGGAARVLRRGREAFDFRPGLPLESFWTVFALPSEKSKGNRVAGHVEQLHVSRCFEASAGKMGCISCHDPHVLPDAQEQEGYYRERCLKCHEQHPCSEPLTQRKQKSPTDNCVGCHMPQGRTDITHVALTDHRILRRPEAGAGSSETRSAMEQQGLQPFHQRDMNDPELMRDLGVALMDQARVRPTAERPLASRIALPLLEQAVEAHADDLPARDALTLALGFQDYLQKALVTVQDTLKQAPHREWTLSDAAMICESLQKNDESLRYWQQVLVINPWSSRYRYQVARHLALRQDWEQASAECETVLKHNASHFESRTLLVECLLKRGKTDQAWAELQIAIALRPAEAEEMKRRFELQRKQP